MFFLSFLAIILIASFYVVLGERSLWFFAAALITAILYDNKQLFKFMFKG